MGEMITKVSAGKMKGQDATPPPLWRHYLFVDLKRRLSPGRSPEKQGGPKMPTAGRTPPWPAKAYNSLVDSAL